MRVTAFRAYSDAERAKVLDVLTPVIQGWSRRWFGQEASAAGFRNVNGPTDALLNDVLTQVASDLLCGDFDTGWCVPALAEANQSAKLSELMLHLSPAAERDAMSDDLLAPLQRDMACSCLRDLGNILTGERTADGEQCTRFSDVEAMLTRACLIGGGWGVLSLNCAGLDIEVLVGPGTLAEILPPLPPPRILGQVTPAKQAIVGQSTRLTAALGGTLLTIGQFEKLRQGDVIKLDHLVAAPVRLVAASGTEVALGQLGSKEGHKAIRLG